MCVKINRYINILEEELSVLEERMGNSGVIKIKTISSLFESLVPISFKFGEGVLGILNAKIMTTIILLCYNCGHTV